MRAKSRLRNLATVKMTQGDREKHHEAPNGFIKILRRFVFVTCYTAFFGFLALEFVFGLVAKPLPLILYLALLSVGMGFQTNIWPVLQRMFSK